MAPPKLKLEHDFYLAYFNPAHFSHEQIQQQNFRHKPRSYFNPAQVAERQQVKAHEPRAKAQYASFYAPIVNRRSFDI